MGKLIPRRDLDEPTEPKAPVPLATPADAKKTARMGPKEALDELQRLADDRIRGVLGVAIGHVQQLQGEGRRLQGRIEELEQKLVAAQKRRDSEGPTDKNEDDTPSS